MFIEVGAVQIEVNEGNDPALPVRLRANGETVRMTMKQYADLTDFLVGMRFTQVIRNLGAPHTT